MASVSVEADSLAMLLTTPDNTSTARHLIMNGPSSAGLDTPEQSSAARNPLSRMQVHVDAASALERDFDGLAAKHFLENNWLLAVGVIAAYVAFVLAGPVYMKNRPRFELRLPLIVWNLTLAGFSIFGTYRAAPFFHDAVTHRGVYGVVCDNAFFEMPVVGFWSHIFTLSKLVELGDTVFIVLRKQPLIFLHWYHHITVLLYCWLGNSEFASTGQFFGIMNYGVHSLMYSYYALKAMRFRLPTVVALVITTCQLSQMVVGIAVNLLAYSFKSTGRPCELSDLNIRLSFLMYFSYFVLFANFFYRAYLAKNKRCGAAVQKSTERVLSQAQMLAKKAM